MRAIILLLAMALTGTAIAELVSGDDALLSIVANRSEKMVRITDKPHFMQHIVTVACAPLAFGTPAAATTFTGTISSNGALTISNNPPSVVSGTATSGTLPPVTVSGSGISLQSTTGGPHEGKYFHVYVTKPGETVLKEGKGTYPEGTVVLKEKYTDATGKNTELFTAMVKRAKGFNPEGGDWEYFVISGDAKKITQGGKIQSCIDCHDSYKSTDYVTRDYMGADHP